MKSKHYISKYKLDKVTIFNHNTFSIDFINEFRSSIELYKTFNSWNQELFWKVIQEMKSKWFNIDKKCLVILPEKLWSYMYNAVFIPTLEVEFPYIGKMKDKISSARIDELKTIITDIMLNLDKNFGRVSLYGVAIEWDQNYLDNALGDFNYRPNWDLDNLTYKVKSFNDHLLWFAYDELVYQLKKVAAAKAKIQFRIHHERRQRYNTFNVEDWVFNRFRSSGERINKVEYLPYFEALNINIESDKKAITDAYRNLSKKHHPDNGGDGEVFIAITESKNKCMEYFKIING